MIDDKSRITGFNKVFYINYFSVTEKVDEKSDIFY